MRHLLKGVSWDEAAHSLRCGKATVAKCAAKMEEGRIDAERLESMTEAEVSGLFADGRSKRGEECLEPDHARVCDQLARVPKMTLALRWARCLDRDPEGKRPCQYSQFCKKVGDYARTHDPVARVAREPGRTMLVDWAGPAASVFAPVTGLRSPAYLLVASLPWSAWACAECFPDMRARSWISAHARAFQAAGGAPDILVPGNCATATDRRRRSEPTKINDACLEMAEHCGCAVVLGAGPEAEGQGRGGEGGRPVRDARRSPRSRASASRPSGAGRRGAPPLDALDAHPLSRCEGRRDDALFGEERAAPGPPLEPFERFEWRRCKAAPDCHVQRDHMRCSVPFRLVGRTLDVRLGASSAAALDGGEVVAEHRRLRGGRGRRPTGPSRMPPEHLEAQSPWTRAWFERRAGEVGPETRRPVGAVLAAHPVECV